VGGDTFGGKLISNMQHIVIPQKPMKVIMLENSIWSFLLPWFIFYFKIVF
tara:strand:+ start:387 stop:536 length:150 start_codon:yes stop_codon:yes gene_type:complete